MPIAERADPNPHLLVHLREVCAVLATGLVRLRRNTAEDLTRDAAVAREPRESSLHFVARPSGHAKPKKKEFA
jgi:hypothetical protein